MNINKQNLINVQIDISQLYSNVEWLNISNFIEKSVLVSVMLAFSHKKDAIKQI